MQKNYYLYRFFIAPLDFNQTLVESKNTKEELFKKVIINLVENQKTTFKYLKRKNIFYHTINNKSNIFIFNLAREVERLKKIEGERNVEEINDQELKQATIIFHLDFQFVLIEINKVEYYDPKTVKSAIESYFQKEIRKWNHTFHLREVTENQKFWRFVEDMDKLKIIKLTFNAPNAFFGNSDMKNVRKKLEEEKEDSNIEFLETKHINKSTSLKIEGDFKMRINYILSMGGEYFVSAFKRGKKMSLNSKNNIKTLTLNSEFTEKALIKINETLQTIQNALFKNKKDEE